MGQNKGWLQQHGLREKPQLHHINLLPVSFPTLPQDGHYVFELGENLTSRCGLGLGAKILLAGCSLCWDKTNNLLTHDFHPLPAPCSPRAQTRSSARWAKVGRCLAGCRALLPFVLVDAMLHHPPVAASVPAGTFGRVLECWDRKHKDYVAIKIVRNIDKYRHAAMIEVNASSLHLCICTQFAAMSYCCMAVPSAIIAPLPTIMPAAGSAQYIGTQ
jgi:hypothetical protein